MSVGAKAQAWTAPFMEAAVGWGAASIAFTATSRLVMQSAQSAWCGDPALAPGAIAFLGHCLPCWTNGFAAGLVAWTLARLVRLQESGAPS